MQEQQSYNISNYSSILGEYTIFLIAKWGRKGVDSTLESKLGEINVKAESAKKTALVAKAAASTTANKLEDLKRTNLSLN